MPVFMGNAHFLNDFIQIHFGGIKDFCICRGGLDHGAGDQRPSVQADFTPFDELKPAYGDKVRCARSGADKVNGHGGAS
jgi:hypothetical protein